MAISFDLELRVSRALIVKGRESLQVREVCLFHLPLEDLLI